MKCTSRESGSSLGRFSIPERKRALDALRDELRKPERGSRLPAMSGPCALSFLSRS